MVAVSVAYVSLRYCADMLNGLRSTDVYSVGGHGFSMSHVSKETAFGGNAARCTVAMPDEVADCAV